jgi:hypothetical protein
LKKVAKHFHFFDFAWVGSLWWSLGPYAHSYLQNIQVVRIKCVCERCLEKKKGKHGTSRYTKYARGSFLLMGLISFCGGKYLCVVVH